MKNMNRHSGGGRNPAKSISRAADKTIMQSRFAGNYLTDWIPACAGMTKSEVTV
ncbi:MAG: hypothetical protein Q7U91_03600 [Sideroxyarcus sp.]|nr:hypothetical protein [Sideroxyarcus sp.]